MTAVRWVWLLALSAASCSRADENAPQPLDKGSADPLGAVALPELRSCVKRCAERLPGAANPQKVDEDCRAECYQGCLDQCDREVGDRPGEFKTRCREDCERQRQHL